VPAVKIVASVILLSFATVSCAEPSVPAQEFLDKAAQGGMADVAAAQMAMTRATTPDVREFAESVVKEYRLTHQLLEALAAHNHVVLPAAPTPEQRKILRELRTKSGAEFEQAYVAAQITTHEESIALLKAEIERDQNIETKAFAKEMLPSLEAQLKRAYQLAKKEQRSAWLRG
jgi:putative membrane protein